MARNDDGRRRGRARRLSSVVASLPESRAILHAQREVGEFWTPRQRQAARIHEISYRACFKPQLPAWFIEKYTAPGEIVYDPFMGRGTTPVEAALRGRVPYGNDINPLSRALTEPRLDPPSLAEIVDRLERIPFRRFGKSGVEHEELRTFYHPRTLARIEGLRRWLAGRESRTRGRRNRPLDTHGRAEPPDGAFARVLLRPDHAAQPGGDGRKAKNHQ